MKVDFLGIGDSVVDSFIHLKDAQVYCDMDQKNCKLCLRFGDKIPFESATTVPAAGNSSNAAISASRLGLKSALVSHIGGDENGQFCLSSLKKNGVNTKFITKEKEKNTNHNYILWYDTDRTILVKHNQFDLKLPKLPKVKWIYLSSLPENSLPYHQEIAKYLKENPETKLAFQPGTFQMKIGVEKLKDIYARTEIFFCNLEEAGRILKKEKAEILELARGLQALGPKIISISDGGNGAYLYFNNELWHLPAYPNNATSIERTGAGDAFSSAIVSALALGKTPLEAFTWGPVNAMSVIQQVGAQAGLLSRKDLEEYLKNAPVDYKPKKIN